MRKYDHALAPLSHAQFDILAALAARPLYARALIHQVYEESQGAVYITPSSMQHQLQVLLAKRLIQFDPYAYSMKASTGKFYSLTPHGAQELERNIKRQQSTIYMAKHNLQRYQARAHI